MDQTRLKGGLQKGPNRVRFIVEKTRWRQGILRIQHVVATDQERNAYLHGPPGRCRTPPTFTRSSADVSRAFQYPTWLSRGVRSLDKVSATCLLRKTASGPCCLLYMAIRVASINGEIAPPNRWSRDAYDETRTTVDAMRRRLGCDTKLY